MRTFVVGFVRFIGAFQAGVGAYQVPHNRCEPVAAGVIVAAAVFVLNWELGDVPTLREVVLRGYVAPWCVVTAAYLCFIEPASWDAASGGAERLISDVLNRTPTSAYFAAAGFGGYQAHIAGPGGTFRSPPTC